MSKDRIANRPASLAELRRRSEEVGKGQSISSEKLIEKLQNRRRR